ncbi:SH3 domain-containing protein [Pedobacter sp. D749]|uniref:SH3 domain-containing protein n=1 Tax=Pedobacter sp. D749 TaxID=2856523 RepID=UPI001046A060|nr:SH3 domain-containing protein [Pedobacter sp. D749]QXU40083.1 SH3 domain-containing protein [Pedobacter sp. D749]
MTRIFFLLIALSIFANRLSAQETYRVKADKLRVRESSDPKSKVIGNIAQNGNITVLDASNDKFYKVKFKNREGWVSKDFVEKITPAAKPTTPQATTAQTGAATQTATSTDMYRVTADDLRVRQQADPKSKIVGYLPKNENVAVIDSSNTSFYKIKVTNGEGWVSKEFLVRVSPVKAVIEKTSVTASVPLVKTDYTNIIFFAVVALILITILYFSIKYASGNKFLIGFAVLVILVTGYFCYITFIQAKAVTGTFASIEDIQYKTFNFKSKDSVTVTDAYTDSIFTSKYVIEGDMIKLYDQQNTIMLLIRDDKTLIGEGFTRGTFTKK